MNLLLQQKKNLYLVQVLRGVASLLVVLYHTTVNFSEKTGNEFIFGSFLFGASGVDVFFVLSGFIITYTSYSKLGHPAGLWPFIKRRIIRIVPAYWIIISMFLLLQVLLPSFYRTHYDISLNNILHTYLLLPEHEMINGVSWTLTFELFFYLLFAIAFLVPSKKWIFFFSVIYSLVLISMAVAGFNLLQGNAGLRLLVSPLNVEFFMGVLSVLLIPRITQRAAITLIVTGVLLFIVGGIVTNQGITLVGNVYNRVILFGIPSFMVLSGIVRLELGRSFKVHTVLISLGEASYSLYLLHLPLLVAAITVLKKFSIDNVFLLHLALLTIILLICALSIFFYKKIEKPLIDKLNALARDKKRVT